MLKKWAVSISLLVLALGILVFVLASLGHRKHTPMAEYKAAFENADAKMHALLHKFQYYQPIPNEEVFDTIVSLQRLQIAALKVDDYTVAEKTLGTMLRLQRFLMSQSLGIPNEVKPGDPSVDPPVRPAPVDPPIPRKNHNPEANPAV